MFAETMQSFIDAEFNTHMGYAKHDIKNKKTANSRNGTMSPKMARTDMGSIELHVPRDRNEEYEPQIEKKHQTDLLGMEQQIILMYTKGILGKKHWGKLLKFREKLN